MKLSEFHFDLPPELIAQEPLADRPASRLLVLGSAADPEGGLDDRVFRDLPDLLSPDALLILNEARVIPARFLGRRASGGKVEVLLIEPRADGTWEALVKAGGTLRPPDEVLELEGGQARLHLVAKTGGGRYAVRFADDEQALTAAERCGRMPLPPYIDRPASAADRERYQTVFARVPGAIAAPTSGLHFTPDLLQAVEARGVEVARLVLHVGLGTFLPVRAETVEDHDMHAERYAIPAATLAAVEAARAAGRPVIACGTTAVRALEAWAATGEAEGSTKLFITPGYDFTVVDGLITNFHLPESTLMMLVSALAGRERILAAYAHAVAQRYRFYSYGDAMFIRPRPRGHQQQRS